jgi:Phasin protein
MVTTPDTRKPTEVREPEARIRKIGEAADRATDQAQDMGEKGAEVAAQATNTAAGVARRAAEQGRETFGRGLRTMAGASLPLAEQGYGEGRRLVETSARVADVYRKAADDTAGDVQALVATYSQLGQGLQRMQTAYFDLMQRSLARARRQPQDLLRCKTPVEFAEVQKDLFADGVAFMMESSTTLLRLAGEVVQSAAGPLEGRARAHH